MVSAGLAAARGAGLAGSGLAPSGGRAQPRFAVPSRSGSPSVCFAAAEFQQGHFYSQRHGSEGAEAEPQGPNGARNKTPFRAPLPTTLTRSSHTDTVTHCGPTSSEHSQPTKPASPPSCAALTWPGGKHEGATR